jgi:hypothetical protein
MRSKLMELSPEDKARIEAEERYREQIREEGREKERERQGWACASCLLIIFAPILGFVAFFLILAALAALDINPG